MIKMVDEKMESSNLYLIQEQLKEQMQNGLELLKDTEYRYRNTVITNFIEYGDCDSERKQRL